jgi:hypothetical protein
MAFKLTKGETVNLHNLQAEIEIAGAKLEDEIRDYEMQIGALIAKGNEAIGEYNEVVRKAVEFCEVIAADNRNEFDDKSERWQDSDAGMEAASWIDQWEQNDLEEIELFEEIDLERDTGAALGVLEGLPLD